MEKKLIGEISGIKIIGGQITSRIVAKDNSEKHSTMKVLVPKAISNGVIDHDSLGTIDVKLTVDSKKFTKCDDIIMKLSTPYDACLVTKGDEEMLVPSFCAIINNLPDNINKNYLLCYLNSEVCQTQLKTLVNSSIFQVLSVGTIKKIKIPLPSKEEQDRIGNEYQSALKKIDVLKKIIKLEKERVNAEIYMMEEE